MSHMICIRSLFATVISSHFPRTLAILGGALLLIISCILWQPGSRVQAFGRLIINAADGEAFALPEARVGSAYEFQFQTEGGLAPLRWSIVAGLMPQGLRLEENGKLRGVPAQAKAEAYAFVVEVTDSAKTPQRFSLPCSLVVNAAPLRIVMNAPKLRIVTSEGHNNASPTLNNAVDTTRRPAEKDLFVSIAPGAFATPTPVPSFGPPLSAPSPIAAATPTPGTICGRLRPTSLDDILVIIPTLPTVHDVIHPPNSAPEIPEGPAKWWETIQEGSRFNASCHDRFKGVVDGKSQTKEGDQKQATIKFLHWFLNAWEQSKDEINNLSCQSPNFNERGIKLCKKDKQAIDGKYANLTPDTIRRQIKLLSTYIGNITVYLKNGENQLNATTDRDGNFIKENIPSEVLYQLSTDGDMRHSKRDYKLEAGEKVRLNLDIEDRPVSLLARAVVGYQQAGAAATSIEQNYYFDLFVSQALPFHQKIDPDFGEKWRTWGAIRAISVPQSGDVSIGNFIGSGTNNFVAKVSELKLKDAARVFDYLGGVEVQFARFGKNCNLLPSFDGYTKQKFLLSLIASGGFVTPTNPIETQPKVYELTDQIKTEFNRTDQHGNLINPQLAESIKGKQYIAFLPNDRDRFFRQYYVGLRMQTFYFNRHNVPLQRFPTQLDLTIGQNEYVTGGRFRGAVVRLDAYYPLPYDKMSFINLFGTAVFKPARVRETTPLLLKEALIQNPPGSNPATSPLPPTDPKVGLIPVGQFNRDYYRVGVGIDLPTLLQKLLNRP